MSAACAAMAFCGFLVLVPNLGAPRAAFGQWLPCALQRFCHFLFAFFCSLSLLLPLLSFRLPGFACLVIAVLVLCVPAFFRAFP